MKENYKQQKYTRQTSRVFTQITEKLFRNYWHILFFSWVTSILAINMEFFFIWAPLKFFSFFPSPQATTPVGAMFIFCLDWLNHLLISLPVSTPNPSNIFHIHSQNSLWRMLTLLRTLQWFPTAHMINYQVSSPWGSGSLCSVPLFLFALLQSRCLLCSSIHSSILGFFFFCAHACALLCLHSFEPDVSLPNMLPLLLPFLERSLILSSGLSEKFLS